MPLVRIDVPATTSASFRSDLSEAVQQSLHAALGVPMEERFHVIAEHGIGGFVVGPSYLGVSRSADAVMIQVRVNRGRDANKKEHFSPRSPMERMLGSGSDARIW